MRSIALGGRKGGLSPTYIGRQKGNHKGHKGGTKITKVILGALRAPIPLFVPFVLSLVPFVSPLFPLLPTRHSPLAEL